MILIYDIIQQYCSWDRQTIYARYIWAKVGMVSWSEKRDHDKKRRSKRMAGGDWYDIGLQYVTLSCYLKSLPSRRRLLTSIEEWSVKAEPLLGPIPAFSAASICCNVFSLICSPASFSVHCYFHMSDVISSLSYCGGWHIYARIISLSKRSLSASLHLRWAGSGTPNRITTHTSTALSV